ncbi:pterin-4-alpha-carbinolamine dehydratase [Mycolicibacterium rhodesiae JS60]|nr:pterin-4-alpha-carbinolamine dehydratase [Mycolicibacterium rhodesiae JS60]
MLGSAAATRLTERYVNVVLAASFLGLDAETLLDGRTLGPGRDEPECPVDLGALLAVDGPDDPAGPAVSAAATAGVEAIAAPTPRAIADAPIHMAMRLLGRGTDMPPNSAGKARSHVILESSVVCISAPEPSARQTISSIGAEFAWAGQLRPRIQRVARYSSDRGKAPVCRFNRPSIGDTYIMPVLTDEEVDAAAKNLDGWERADGALRRSVKFPTFLAGIDAVRRVAEHAESEDHHPDIDIRWRTVTFALVTHSEGGITDKDVQMASDINGIVDDR